VTRGQRAAYVALLLATVASLLTFLLWWGRPEHVPSNFAGWAHVFDVALFVVLTMVFGHRVFMDCLTWAVVWFVQPRQQAPEPPAGLRVAFITTFVPSSEPIDMLRENLPAILAVDYPHDTWLLDEGNSTEARDVCSELGVRYFTRNGERRYNLVAGPFTRRTKGGNHNAWYDTFGDDYDVVAQIDTDFAPRHDFLTATLGWFTDPRVGFVGTPQIYGNTDASFVAKGAAQQLYTFYGPILRGLAARGHATMIGANHVVRVAALRDVGLYAGHLTEDLLTGMRLHAAGWESRYVAEPLAVGEGPWTWEAYFTQQMRWAFGCMDILRTHTRALIRRMPPMQASFYLALQQHYFGGIATAAGVLLLMAYFVAGLVPAAVGLVEMLAWATPFVVMRLVLHRWTQRLNAVPSREHGWLLAGRYSAGVTWPVYFLAAIGVVRQKRLGFRVTPKGEAAQPRTPIRVYLPHLVVGLALTAGLASVPWTGRTAIPMIFWAGSTALLLLSFVVLIWHADHAAARPTDDIALLRGDVVDLTAEVAWQVDVRDEGHQLAP
jgi:cellulose synthase (UDP-forming)